MSCTGSITSRGNDSSKYKFSLNLEQILKVGVTDEFCDFEKFFTVDTYAYCVSTFFTGHFLTQSMVSIFRVKEKVFIFQSQAICWITAPSFTPSLPSFLVVKQEPLLVGNLSQLLEATYIPWSADPSSASEQKYVKAFSHLEFLQLSLQLHLFCLQPAPRSSLFYVCNLSHICKVPFPQNRTSFQVPGIMAWTTLGPVPPAAVLCMIYAYR